MTVEEEPRPVESQTARRTGQALLNALVRELHGAGAFPKLIKKSNSSLDDEVFHVGNLPLGGRIAVTGSRNTLRWQRVYRLVRGQRKRGNWGALVTPNWHHGTGATVHIPLEEFATIVGKLDQLSRERERWLNGPADVADGGNGRR